MQNDFPKLSNSCKIWYTLDTLLIDLITVMLHEKECTNILPDDRSLAFGVKEELIAQR